MSSTPLPLKGIRVVDAASLFAGPVIATLLGDYGADVIKVEHPSGDNLRKLGWQKEGVSLWWALIGRNKRSVTLKLSDPQGAEVMRRLLSTADVLVENFRTGTLERWGPGWEELHELNPRLVMVRTTGFGQDGPYARRPGFGTLAESMSGYAHIARERLEHVAHRADLYEVRALIEPHAAGRAAMRIAGPELERLTELCRLAEARGGADQESVNDQMVLNDEFHGIILQAAQSPRLEAAMSALVGIPRTFRASFWRDDDQRAQSLFCHHELVSACHARRSDMAETVMRLHIQGACVFLMKVMNGNR
jgi:DNA-binding FadR family transcriptional regulator